MSKRKTQTYTPEYRSEAIKLVLEQGLSVSEAATRLSMNQGTLAYWVTQARKGVKSASSIAGSQSAAELAAENKRLRKELSEARMERDILKKRRRTLPGHHCPVRIREAMAIGLPVQAALPGFSGVPQRILCLA